MEDLIDLELERYLQENNVAKWFCEFSLTESTPDYTVFTKTRARIGTELLSDIFSRLRNQLKQQGVMNEVFSFVNASHLITKANLWQERAKAIKVSRPAELPRWPLAKQCRNLSIHTASIRQTLRSFHYPSEQTSSVVALIYSPRI